MANKGTRIDRIVSRLKNNPIVAAIILVGLVLASLATFTNSVQEIVKAFQNLNAPRVTGEWQSEVLTGPRHDWRPYQLIFRLKADGLRLIGTVRYVKPANQDGETYAISDGKVDGEIISFYYLGGWIAPDSHYIKELFYGVLSGDEIHFIYQLDDGSSPPLEFTAKRVAEARPSKAK